MTPNIQHRHLHHQIHPETETLVIGTFNPDTLENPADYFYGRSRNFMWTLLPTAFGEASLKGKSREEKISFINKHKIDFTDLIAEVAVDEVANYDDIYLDSRVTEWRDVIAQISQLPHLKRVCLTRKSFGGILHMKSRVDAIQSYCESKNIPFVCLVTPARFYNVAKQAEWTRFFNK